jgi:cullin 1
MAQNVIMLEDGWAARTPRTRHRSSLGVAPRSPIRQRLAPGVGAGNGGRERPCRTYPWPHPHPPRWTKLKTGGVQKIEAILEDMKDGVYKNRISTDEYSALYTTVYTMCTQKPPNNWSEHLYNNYCEAVKDYLQSRILPRIKEKHDEYMLRELVRRWDNHKLMIRFLSHVFKYLDRFYVKRLSLPELADVGSQSFHEIVFNAVKREVRTAILALIQREREGEMIDTKLVKDVVGIFVEMGGSRTSLEVYVVDFEEMLLSSTADFYRRAAPPT